jgi:hypothetical protein
MLNAPLSTQAEDWALWQLTRQTIAQHDSKFVLHQWYDETKLK